MVADKAMSNVSLRQKIVTGIILVVMIILLWQVKGLFSRGGKTAVVPETAAIRTQQLAATVPPGFGPRNGTQPAAPQQMQGQPGMPAPQGGGIPGGVPHKEGAPAPH